MSSRPQAAHDGYHQVGFHTALPNDNVDSPTMSHPPVHPSSERQVSSDSTVPLVQDPQRNPQVAFSSPYDPERGQAPTGPSVHSESRNPSWDLLAGIKKLENSYDEFDTRTASQSHLAYADGDIPKTKFIKFYNYLLNVSIVTRWILFIVPVLGMLWIPGILSLTTFPNAKIWGVRLFWWSIWLSVAWGGWWGALAVSRIMPHILRSTIGVVAVATRRYIDWIQVLHRYIALFVWTLIIWVSWGPLIDNQQKLGTGNKSINASDTAARLLFAFVLCSAVLLFEKLSIQWIAGKFHERSYAGLYFSTVIASAGISI